MSAIKKFTIPSLPSTSRGCSVKLGVDPKGKYFCYPSGKLVIVCSLENPEETYEYTEHSSTVTVAKVAPSGYYIASGDVQGNVRIWDTTQSEHILKFSFKALTGRINDIAWDSESKRIIAVGDGKDMFGVAFMFDSGSTVGEISGHSKTLNAVSFKPNRPFKAVTAGDDFSVGFFSGPPYKFVCSISDHSRFVTSVSYSPNGVYFATAGFDSKIFCYNGATGEKLFELRDGENAHAAAIYGLCWSSDSNLLVSCSADATLKLWNVSEKKLERSIKVGTDCVNDQQVGLVQIPNSGKFLSFSLSGQTNFFSSSLEPERQFMGHNKGITGLLKIDDSTFISSSYDGRTLLWNGNFESGKAISGTNSHQAIGIYYCQKTKNLFYLGVDSRLKICNDFNFGFTKEIPFDGHPKSFSHPFILTDSSLLYFDGSKETLIVNDVMKRSISSNCDALVIVSSPKYLAVGTSDSQVYLFDIVEASNEIVFRTKLPLNLRSNACGLSFNPAKDNLLAVSDSTKNIYVFDIEKMCICVNQWVFHNAKAISCCWSNDGEYLVSGSLDACVFVWSLNNPMKKIHLKSTHVDGVTGVIFLNNDTIVSAGQDGCLKVWKIAAFPK